MKASVQIISKENGTRSQLLTVDLKEFADLLRTQKELKLEEHYIIVIAVHKNDEEPTEISQAPLITLENFCKIHEINWKEEEAQANG